MDGEHSFVDVAADAYYRDAVLWAVENEITNGAGRGTHHQNKRKSLPYLRSPKMTV